MNKPDLTRNARAQRHRDRQRQEGRRRMDIFISAQAAAKLDALTSTGLTQAQAIESLLMKSRAQAQKERNDTENT